MSRAVAELLRSATALHALTLHQPWGWAVAECGKDVENRIWPAPESVVGKPLAIHAGLTYDGRAAQSIADTFGLKVPGRDSATKGAVVAVALLERAVRDSRSRWAIPGQWHWCLGHVVRLPKPVQCKGAQGVWKLPAEVLAEVRAQVLEREGTRAAMVGLSPTEGAPTGEQKALAEAVAATTRASHRTWSKGSARGAGPAVSSGTVYVRSSQVVKCIWCGGWWHGESGGQQHAPRIARHRGEWWPECGHGGRFLEDCAGNPAPPPCCAAEWRAAGGPFLAPWVVWSRCPLNPEARHD